MSLIPHQRCHNKEKLIRVTRKENGGFKILNETKSRRETILDVGWAINVFLFKSKCLIINHSIRKTN